MIGSLFQIKNLRQKKEETKKSIQLFDKIPENQLKKKLALPFIELSIKNKNQENINQQIQKIDLSKFLRTNPNQSTLINSQNLNKIIEQTTNQIYKNTIKSNYKQLIASYSKTTQMFTDPDFPPNSFSLGQNLSKKQIKWRRISQIIKNPIFINNIVQPDDILQGDIGDCYFMSSIASIAEHDFRIKNLFGSLQIQPNGIYMAQILCKGVLQQVVVDDYIPTLFNVPIFASPSGGNQIWVMILQKCWAKVNGSYDKIDKGGLPHQVLHDFTCAPTFYNFISGQPKQQQLIFAKILQAINLGAILCCGTSEDPSIDKQGLLHAHAYSILKVFQKPYRMLKIRNPFGMVQWKGKGNEKDTEFWSQISQEDKKNLGYIDKNDGIFFILWEDFVKVFIMVDFCMVQDNASYLYLQTGFKFQQPKLFEIQIFQQIPRLTICLSQDNLQTYSQAEKQLGLAKTILIISKNIIDDDIQSFSFLKASEYNYLPDHYMVLQKLQKGKYTLYVQCNWHSQKQKKATLSFYGEGKFKFYQQIQNNYEQFIQRTVLNHSRRNQKKKQFLSKDLTAWKCSQLLMGRGQLGYFVYCVEKNSTIKLGVQFDQKQFIQKSISIIGSYKGKGKIKLIINPGQIVVVLLKFHPYKAVSKIDLPQPKVKKLT